MGPNVPNVLVTVAVGLLLGGPCASIVWVALPPDWRGPGVPLAVGAATLGLVAALRHGRRRSPGAGRGGEGASRPEAP